MDRDNVINEIEELLNGYPVFIPEAAKRGLSDALALLKEQEAVEPITQSVYNSDEWFYVCGSCKKGVIERGDKFCRWCGQAVKWE